MLAAALASGAGHVEAAGAQLDVPAGPLSEALLALARQAHVSIVFSPDITRGIDSPALAGRYELAAALDTLIGGHCLRYELIRPTLVALKDGCNIAATTAPLASAGTPAAPARLADSARAPGGLEEMVVHAEYVTGSRIRHPAYASPSPVDVISRPEIEAAGFQAVDEVLRYVPAVAGNSTSTLISNGGDGTSTVTLRGLPASNTLVLLNGRRLNPNALTGAAVDLNTLPIGFVDRIEIVKDGASAIYGSDAVAGVVNVITRNDIDGVAFNAYAGASAHGDLDTRNLSALFGHQDDTWNIAGGLAWYDQAPLYSRDRSISSSSDGRPDGGIDKRSSATSPARVTPWGVPLILADPSFDGSDPSHFRPATDEDRYEFRDGTTSIVPSERWSAFLEGAVMLGGVEVYGEALYTGTEAETELAPTPVFTNFETIDLTVSAANPYNPFGVDVADARRRITELPTRTQENLSRTERVTLGVRGQAGTTNWDLSAQHSTTHAEENFYNAISASRTQQALGPDCVAPCVPLNFFGPHGSITPAMLDWIGVSLASDGTSRLRTLEANIDFPVGDLPAGTVEVASGVVYRHEFFATSPDPVLAAADSVGAANFGPTDGERSVWEAYAEAYVPLLRDQPRVKSLDLHLAGRVSQYSDFGRTTNPRVALRFEPLDGLTFRTSYAHGFRAPTLRQLYGSEYQSFEQLNDPCSLPANVITMPGCTQRSDPTLVQFLTTKGGDATLQAESSRTYGFGVVWQPVFADDLQMSIDYFDIRQENVVDASAQYIVNENAEHLRFPLRVERDELGNMTRVRATLQNIGERDVSGYDVALDWQLAQTGYGTWTTALKATHISEFEDRFDPSAPKRDQAGTFSDEASGGNGALPDWKMSVGLHWHRGHWQAQYNVYYVSSVDEIVPIIEESRTMEAWHTHNLQVGYFGPLTGWFKISAGINNLFDNEPPFSAAAFNDSYDGRTYDLTGRYLYLFVEKTI